MTGSPYNQYAYDILDKLMKDKRVDMVKSPIDILHHSCY